MLDKIIQYPTLHRARSLCIDLSQQTNEHVDSADAIVDCLLASSRVNKVLQQLSLTLLNAESSLRGLIAHRRFVDLQIHDAFRTILDKVDLFGGSPPAGIVDVGSEAQDINRLLKVGNIFDLIGRHVAHRTINAPAEPCVMRCMVLKQGYVLQHL